MLINVQVKPNSKQQKIEKLADNSFIIRLKSSPVDGKANQELIKLLAKYFTVSQSQVRIKLGQTSKQKLVEIE